MRPEINEVYNLYPNLVYSSYFAVVNKFVPVNLQISVALGTPSWFNGTKYSKLCPPRELLDAYKNGLDGTIYEGKTITLDYIDTGITIDFINGKLTNKSYEEVYRKEVLAKLNPIEVYNDLKGKVICCWESSKDFCHRYIILTWLRETLGSDFVGWELGKIDTAYFKSE